MMKMVINQLKKLSHQTDDLISAPFPSVDFNIVMYLVLLNNVQLVDDIKALL